MSDFGNETVSAAMNMAGKSMEAVVSLIKFLLPNQEKKAAKLSNKLRKAQIKSLKNDEYKSDYIEFLNAKKGAVQLKNMIKSKEKITTIAQSMNEKDVKRFTKLAKMYGVSFSKVKDDSNKEKKKALKKELNELVKKGELSNDEKNRMDSINKELEQLSKQKEQYILFVYEKDLDTILNITDRMNREIQMEAVDKEIKDITNKGMENLTEEDKQRLDELNNLKNSYINEEFKSINDKNNNRVLNNEYEKMSFDEAIEQLTDRGADKEPAVLCDRTNPNNYIVIHAEERTYEDRTHIDTIFDVYKNDEHQTCDLYKDVHGQFSFKHDLNGNPTSEKGMENWKKIKREMKEKGNFTDNVISFKNIAEYQTYRAEFEKIQSTIKPKEITFSMENDQNSYKDYMGIINKLKGRLSEYEFALNDNKEICKAGENIPINESELSSDNKIKYKDATFIARQISIYENMNTLQTQMAVISQQRDMNEELFKNSNEKEAIKDNYERSKKEYDRAINEINEKINELSKENNDLEMRRESLMSIEVMNNLNNEKVTLGEEKEEKEVTLGEERDTQGIEKWERDISNSNNKVDNNIGKQKENKIIAGKQDNSRE